MGLFRRNLESAYITTLDPFTSHHTMKFVDIFTERCVNTMVWYHALGDDSIPTAGSILPDLVNTLSPLANLHHGHDSNAGCFYILNELIMKSQPILNYY